MNPFEAVVAAELVSLLRAGAPPRAVRLTVRELVVERILRGPLGPREVGETVEATVRAACALVNERGASEEWVEIVCGASFEAVRGHGGESARWLGQATSAALSVLDELTQARAEDPTWSWLTRRLERWEIPGKASGRACSTGCTP
jgi:hypothetical protein